MSGWTTADSNDLISWRSERILPYLPNSQEASLGKFARNRAELSVRLLEPLFPPGNKAYSEMGCSIATRGSLSNACFSRIAFGNRRLARIRADKQSRTVSTRKPSPVCRFSYGNYQPWSRVIASLEERRARINPSGAKVSGRLKLYRFPGGNRRARHAPPFLGGRNHLLSGWSSSPTQRTCALLKRDDRPRVKIGSFYTETERKLGRDGLMQFPPKNRCCR